MAKRYKPEEIITNDRPPGVAPFRNGATSEIGSRPIAWPSARHQQEFLNLSSARVKALNRALFEAGVFVIGERLAGVPRMLTETRSLFERRHLVAAVAGALVGTGAGAERAAVEVERLVNKGYVVVLGRDRRSPHQLYSTPEMIRIEHELREIAGRLAAIADREQIVGEDRAVLIFAALTHDLAKSPVERGGTTLQRLKRGSLRWTAHGHEEAGGPMARALLSQIGIASRIIERVVPLVENHLQHVQLAGSGPVSASAVRRLAERLAPANIHELVLLIEADLSGRPPLPAMLPASASKIRQVAERDGTLSGRPVNPIKGRDVLPFYQGRPGPHIGVAVAAAYAAYLDGAFTSFEDGLSWLETWLANRARLVRGQDVLAYLDRPGSEVGVVLRAAWDAQVAGEFVDREGAERWLAEYMVKRTVTCPAIFPPPR